MSALICTTGMCAQGRASVEEMVQVFNQLSNDTSLSFNVARFQSTVESIRATADSYSPLNDWIPFNKECCALKDIGAQADTVTRQMLDSVGASSAGIGPGTTGDYGDWAAALVPFAIAFGVAYVVLGPSSNWRRFLK